MKEILQRRGKFTISRDYIRRKPEEVQKILTDILVVQISDDFMRDSLVYIGYSESFDIIIENSAVLPEYTPSINPETNKVMWRREKEYTEEDVKTMFNELKQEIKKGYSLSIKVPSEERYLR